MSRYGRDPHRRLTLQQRRVLYERAQGRCQRCGVELGVDYHNAHLVAWTNGGATSSEQMQAWCASCNLRLGAHDVGQVEDVQLRAWQAAALPRILRRLWDTGVATLHAAPGAGKTLFAGATFRSLFDARLIDRMIVVVPNLALVEQWAQSLGQLRVHLDTQPRDGAIEHPDTVGAIVTYQSLDGAAGAHAVQVARNSTLVVLDEVHHVGESAAWARAVERMVGDVSAGGRPTATVLNMTGTLFRSRNTQRISTVRYDQVTTAEGEEKLQAVADWSEPTANLIGVELRAPDLYTYGGEVRLVDIHAEQVVTADIADLDRDQRSAVIRFASLSRPWLRGFAAEAVRLLQNQLLAIGGEEREPLKMLFVANDISAARRAADAINTVTGQEFARLVVSDDPSALRTLRSAAQERRSCAIVAVKMVTEGFDCPEVSTIAYATNTIAHLFVAQVMARAMRITRTERADRRMLPAQILIPDHPQLRRAFAAAMAGALHTIDLDRDNPDDPGSGSGGERLPRYELLDLSDPRLRQATVLTQADGDVPAAELALTIAACSQVGIPETYAPRVAVVSRRYRPPLRVYSPEDETTAAGTAAAGGTSIAVSEPVVSAAQADPRSLNRAHRARVTRAASWMHEHLDHDQRYDHIGSFQNLANQAAGIPRGGRDHATTAQLTAVADWMIVRIIEHCQTHDEPVPSWIDEENQR